jgi:hypothetical protein
MEFETAGIEIAEEIANVAHEDLTAMINSELIGADSLLSTIKQKIIHFLDTVEKYENTPKNIGTIG